MIIGSDGGDIGGVSSNREDNREKHVRWQGNRVTIPRSLTKRNSRGERVRGIQRGGGRGGYGQFKVGVGS